MTYSDIACMLTVNAVIYCRTSADDSMATFWHHFSTKGIRKVLHLQAMLTVNTRVKDHFYQNMTLVKSHLRGQKPTSVWPARLFTVVTSRREAEVREQ